MRIQAMSRKGNRVTADVDWIYLRPELVRPDGSWDITSQTACAIEVKGTGSKSARFFVVVGLDHNGKPWASISSVKASTQTTKTVFAQWLDFAARAAKLIGGGK